MTADELSAPLGQMPRKQRRKFPIAVPHVIAGALALFLGTFVLWTIVGDDPFGGEPTVAAPVDLRAAAAVNAGGTGKRRQPARSAPLRRAGAGLGAAGEKRSGKPAAKHQDRHHHRRQDRSAAGGGDP